MLCIQASWRVFLLMLFFVGLPFLMAPAQAAVVILYHHVSDTTPASTSISPARFEAQMDYLAQAGFAVVPLTLLTEKLRKGEPLPDKTVAITFDDSYATVYESAFPSLQKRGWQFTFFVNTDVVGTGKTFVSWAQLREMKAAGVTIANHSGSHAHLPHRKPGGRERDFRTRIRADINSAQQILIKELGDAPMILAYPYGEYDSHVQAIARELGYIAFGQQSGVLDGRGDLQAQPRFPFGGSFTELDDFRLKVNSLAMPLAAVNFYTENKKSLNDAIVAAGERPWLALSVSEEAVAARVQCFATGQGAIAIERQGSELWARANTALKPGRMRYNCTALSNEKGRFYWYTQQWLVTDKKGVWVHKD